MDVKAWKVKRFEELLGSYNTAGYRRDSKLTLAPGEHHILAHFSLGSLDTSRKGES